MSYEGLHITSRREDLIGLGVSFLAVIAVMAIGGVVTATGDRDWYQALEKPAVSPPDWLFGPVWTALYVMMAIAAWLVWRRAGIAGAGIALPLYVVQLALNLGWTVLFFGAQAIGLALVEIMLLLFVILATTLAFLRTDRIAAALMAPYLLWVGYAAVLNAGIWILN